MLSRMPLIADLLPTQVTVGMREVEIKRKRWCERSDEGREVFLNAHKVPVVLGPGKHRYIVDRDHLYARCTSKVSRRCQLR